MNLPQPSLYIPDKERAFPVDSSGFLPDRGMTLRDYFAANLPSDEIQDVTYRNLSRDAQELLVGMKHPVEPPPAHPGNMPPADYRIAVVRFQCAVNAALRYMAADAMLKAR